jgi:hypothetical protein
MYNSFLQILNDGRLITLTFDGELLFVDSKFGVLNAGYFIQDKLKELDRSSAFLSSYDNKIFVGDSRQEFASTIGNFDWKQIK